MKEFNEHQEKNISRSAEEKEQNKKRRRTALSVGFLLSLCCVITVVLLTELFASKDGSSVPTEVTANSVMHEGSEMQRSFTARVLQCGQSWVLVEPLEGEPERNSCDKISFSTGNLEEISVTVGTKVEITYDGHIMESYPAQIYAISWHLV